MIALLALYLVAPPDAPWAPARAAAAQAEAEAALVWWQARTGDAAPTLSAPVFIETPTPYDRTTYMDATTPGLYIVARAAGDPTLPNGRSGWARPNGLRLVVLETPARQDATLAALIAHEWGHARYGLPDTEARGDVMGPDYPQAYAQGRVGCVSLRALGGGCVFAPLLKNAEHSTSAGCGRCGDYLPNLVVQLLVQEREVKAHQRFQVPDVITQQPAPRNLGLGLLHQIAPILDMGVRPKADSVTQALVVVKRWLRFDLAQQCTMSLFIHTPSFASAHSSTRAA